MRVLTVGAGIGGLTLAAPLISSSREATDLILPHYQALIFRRNGARS
jgi:hypothetical protein